MALFNFGKKKAEKKVEETTSCCCGFVPKAEEITSCCDEYAEGICCIKVLGSGCKNCHVLLEATKDAAQNIGLNIEVEYITDMEKIMKYGVISMPTLVINGQVASMGKVLKAADVEKLLRQYER